MLLRDLIRHIAIRTIRCRAGDDQNDRLGITPIEALMGQVGSDVDHVAGRRSGFVFKPRAPAMNDRPGKDIESYFETSVDVWW